MNKRFIAPVAAAGTLLLLAGCATEPDCSDALETARTAAQDRQPLGFWIGDVEDACTDAAERAWATVLAESCAPLHGFHAGYADAEAAQACTKTDYQSARNLGEMLADMQAEADEIKKRLEDDSLPPEMRGDLRRRQVAIGRDLPQLEALARMDGYLTPAEVPDP